MLAYQRATGETPPELQLPSLPSSCTYLWNAFIGLHNMRGAGPHGPAPIQPTQILAWAQLHGLTFSPWEIEMIAALDCAALAALAPTPTTRSTP